MQILSGNFMLGGQGKTVEIDESMFGNKWKYNLGRFSEGQWVFGMVEQDTGRSLVFRVPDHQRETLVTRLVGEFIERGTVIVSDKSSPYFNLNDVGYVRLYWSTQQHHKGTLTWSEKEAEGDEGDHENQTTRLPWQVQREWTSSRGEPGRQIQSHVVPQAEIVHVIQA